MGKKGGVRIRHYLEHVRGTVAIRQSMLEKHNGAVRMKRRRGTDR